MPDQSRLAEKPLQENDQEADAERKGGFPQYLMLEYFLLKYLMIEYLLRSRVSFRNIIATLILKV